jgi:dephospho-CoA kinase
MKLCGLTGGVGMGKSTAAGFLLQSGARVVDTDDLARELVQPGQPALAEIKNAFGACVLSADGSLRRPELARRVFSDPAARQQLEAILHPRIRERWQTLAEQWRSENLSLGVVVIPLLYETQAESSFDQIICVACSQVTQSERLRSRAWSPEQIQQRIASQLPVEQKIARANFVLWTDGALETSRQQLAAILRKL